MNYIYIKNEISQILYIQAYSNEKNQNKQTKKDKKVYAYKIESPKNTNQKG